jgi:hypothetical protein
MEDPLGAIGEPEPFADVPVDIDDWPEPGFDEGLDDG